MAGQVQERYQDTELYKIRHSAAHIMAQAVLEMFPDGKVTIGPPVENGFYYDFDLPRNLTPEDLEQIEKRMRQIIAGKHEFKKTVVSAEEARRIFTDQPYKLELIDGLEKGGLDEYGNPLKEKPEISIYQQDSFVDLCRGPHVENTTRDQAGRRQADERGGRLLARRREQQDAAAHLRHGLGERPAAEGLPAPAGGSQEARPPQAGQGTGDLHLRR